MNTTSHFSHSLSLLYSLDLDHGPPNEDYYIHLYYHLWLLPFVIIQYYVYSVYLYGSYDKPLIN